MKESEEAGKINGEGTDLFSDRKEFLGAQKIRFEDMKEHMSGPIISIAFHIVLISFLLSMLVTSSPPERDEIEIELIDMQIVPPEKLPDLPDISEPVENKDFVSDSETNIPEPSPDAPVEVEEFNSKALSIDIVVPNILNIKTSGTPLKLPESMAGRRGPQREAAKKKYDVSSRTERAVKKGLIWLRDHQNSDGSWGQDKSKSPALTAMALLAFLAYGETPMSEDFGHCVLKAIKKLVSYSETANPVEVCAGNGYGHMIVTYALSEAYAMTQVPMLESHMNRMVGYTIKGQNLSGGYNYSYNNSGGRSDTSVIGWACQAMKAALAAGSGEAGLETAMQKSAQCLLNLQSAGRGFVYSTEGLKANPKLGDGGWQTSPIGALCLQLLGDGSAPEVRNAMALMLERQNWVNWKGENGDGKHLEWALYRWYYQTQAYFQHFQGTGKEWREWNRMFTSELLKNQKADGRWETPLMDFRNSSRKSQNHEKGHGEDMFLEDDNPVYASSLCCLMLTVYYRYLPTYQVAGSKKDLTLVSNPAQKDKSGTFPETGARCESAIIIE